MRNDNRVMNIPTARTIQDHPKGIKYIFLFTDDLEILFLIYKNDHTLHRTDGSAWILRAEALSYV